MHLVIADDHALILEGLSTALQRHFPDATIHALTSKAELLACLKRVPVSGLIQDIRFGEHDARHFMRQLTLDFPKVRVLAFSSLEDMLSVQTAFDVGFSGYCFKSEPTSTVIKVVEEMLNTTKNVYSPEVAKLLNHEMNEGLQPLKLSLREREVLTEILKEKSTKEIAAALFVSEKAVEHHRSNLFVKFHVHNVTGLVKKAILLGLTEE